MSKVVKKFPEREIPSSQEVEASIQCADFSFGGDHGNVFAIDHGRPDQVAFFTLRSQLGSPSQSGDDR